MDIHTLASQFANQLQGLIEARVFEQVRASVLAGLGVPVRRGPGRPPKALIAAPGAVVLARPRKKAPRQLCPVPNCRNAAAPVFGMVCAEHKDVPKKKIAAYREARRAKKMGLSPSRGRAASKARPGITPSARRSRKAKRSGRPPVRKASTATASAPAGTDSSLVQ